MFRQQRKPRASLLSKLHGGALFSGIVALFLMISLVMTGCSSTVTISSVVVSDITVTGATITWETSGTAISQVEFGTTASYGVETSLETTEATDHSATLTGLSGSTTYYYRVKSGESVSSGSSFNTVTTVPAVYDVAVSSLMDVSAAVTWSTGTGGTSQVEYGATTSYGSTTTATTALVTDHSVSVAGLTAATTYHYRVKSSGGVSADGTFTTTASIAAVTALWTAGEHNNIDFLIDTGSNTYCGRCHSPMNWDPDAMQGGPVSGSCFNCKGPGPGPDFNTKALGSLALGEVADSGYATGGGTATQLLDTTQNFETTVTVGLMVVNSTDSSHALVTAVVSDTELTTAALTGGVFGASNPMSAGNPTMNTWEDGDKYHIVSAAGFEEYKVIGCTTCHEGGNGPDIAIWNNDTMGYDAVATPGELCGKCHVDGWGGYKAETSADDGAKADSGSADATSTATTLIDAGQDFETTVEVGMIVYNQTDDSLATVTVVVSDTELTTTALVGRPGVVASDSTYQEDDSYTIYEGPLVAGDAFEGTSHQITLGGSAHPNEIGISAADRAPVYCTDCHDPHSGVADCESCHTTLPAASGHVAGMAKVTCVACHGADPVLNEVGWNADDTAFTVGVSAAGRGGGPAVFGAANTHIFGRLGKNCNDCHYVIDDDHTEANPWGLSDKADV